MNMPTKSRHPLGRATKPAVERRRSGENRVEALEVRIAPAAVVSVAGNFNFEEAVDFDHWTVSAGPGSALTDYTSTTSVIRGAFAPEGNAYAHLSFEGRATIGTTGFGPSIQSENFSAAAGEEISVAWRATNGIDTAHPRGRLFASNGTPVGTFFDADSGTTAFTNATVTVPSDGEYYLLFEAGSSDASVGGLVGATLDIDAIHRTPDGITTTTLPNGQSSVDVSGSSLTGNTFLITLDDTSQFAQIFVNGNLNFIQPLSSIDRINITGGDANDQLTVDSSRGLIPLAEGIHFNGGASSDTLSLIQTGGLSNVTDTFSVGPGLGDGISEISDGTLVQTVNFQNVEPVLDNVASASLTVNATTADNTITSTDGPGGGSFTGATALITIDGFATFEFNNKTSLTLNALAGSDTISLNNSSTPAGLTGALIQGGDPSLPVGDTLHFANAGSIHPVAIGTGTITASGFPTVNFTGMEATAVGGYTLTRGGGGLLVTATGDQDFTGQEDAFVITTSASDQFLRMELNGSIGLYANQSAIAQIDVSGLAGDDSLTLIGTAAVDAFTLNPTAADTGTGGITGRVAIGYTGIELVVLNGLEEADTFALGGGFGRLEVNGGNGDDTVDLSGTAAADAFTFNPTAADAGNVGITGGAAIGYTEIESVVLNGLGEDDTFALGGAFGSLKVDGGSGDDTVDLTGTPAADAFTFSPTAADAGFVGIAGGAAIDYTVVEAMLLNGLGDDDTFALDGAFGMVGVNGGSGADTVDLTGTAASDIFTFSPLSVDTATVAIAGGAAVGYTLIESLVLNGIGGDDSFVLGGTFGALSVNGGSGDDTVDLTGTAGPDAFAFSPTAADAGNAGIRPIDVAIADLNGDGFADIVAVNPGTARINVLLNLGDGTFGTPISYGTRGLVPRDIVIGNFDANRGLDLAVTNRKSNTVAILSGDAQGGFAKPTLIKTPANPSAITVGHVDGDMIDDIVITHPAVNKISVLLGTGTGLGPATAFKTAGKRPTDVVIGDFNGDGNSDVATANLRSDNVDFFQGDGLGGLAVPTQFATGLRPSALTFADFNLDGVLDLAVSNRVSEFVSILLSNGAVAAATQFQSQLEVPLSGGHAPVAIIAKDLNGDGHADLAFGNTIGSNFTVLIGGNFATFSEPYEFDAGLLPGIPKGGLAVADLNNDGLLDIVNTVRNRLEVRVFLRKFEILP